MKLRLFIAAIIILTPAIIILNFFIRLGIPQPEPPAPQEVPNAAQLLTDYPTKTIVQLDSGDFAGLTPKNRLFVVHEGRTADVPFPDRRGSKTAVAIHANPGTKQVFIQLHDLVTGQRHWVLYDLNTNTQVHSYNPGIRDIAGISNGKDKIAYIFHRDEVSSLATAELSGANWQDWANINPDARILHYSEDGIVAAEPLGDGQMVVKYYPSPGQAAADVHRGSKNNVVSPDGKLVAGISNGKLIIRDLTGKSVHELPLGRDDRFAWINTDQLAVTTPGSTTVTLLRSTSGDKESIEIQNNTEFPADWQPVGSLGHRLLVLTTFAESQFLLAIPLGNRL